MSESDPELRRRLEALADQQTPRGAGAVLDGARAHAAAPGVAQRPALIVLSIAACLALIVTTATVVTSNTGTKGRPVAMASGSTTSTSAGTVAAEPGATDPSTTAPAVTTPTTAVTK